MTDRARQWLRFLGALGGFVLACVGFVAAADLVMRWFQWIDPGPVSEVVSLVILFIVGNAIADGVWWFTEARHRERRERELQAHADLHHDGIWPGGRL